MDINNSVEIASCFGGYVVKVTTRDANSEESETEPHICLSIDEVVAKVRLSLTSIDANPDSDYREIEKKIDSASADSPRKS